MNVLARIACVVVAAGGLTVGALAAEPSVVGERPYPFGPLSIQGGVFRAKEGHDVDLEDAADSARRALPGHEAVVFDWSDPPSIIVGRVDGRTEPGPLREWLVASGLPLRGPEEASMGRSAPDWFARPRRAHDVLFALIATAASAAIVGALTRRRQPAQ